MPKFHEDDPPASAEIVSIAERVSARFAEWLRRRGLVRDDHDELPSTEPGAIEACAETALGLGKVGTVNDDGKLEKPDPDEARFGDRKNGPHVGEADGFSIHAGVVVGRGDFDGRERIARYCSRPAISLERLSLTKDRRVAYRIKRSSQSTGPTHRLMTPLEFMARLSALIPPPRAPLIRSHGVLTPHAKWRPARRRAPSASASSSPRRTPWTSTTARSATRDCGGSGACRPTRTGRA